MNTQDVIAIATFAIALLGVVYAFGLRDAKLSNLEEDLNGLGKKVSKFDTRLDRLSEFYVRVDQRVAHLQEEILGCERSDRLRENDNEKTYFSPNSGIDL